MKIYKKFIFFSLFCSLVCFVYIISILYIYDPFMFFHKPYFRDLSYMTDDRRQTKSIVDNNNFDSIILGTSMLKNTSALEASNLLGGKWINLSLDGSSFEERAVILKYVLKKKKLKNVLYSLDVFAFDPNHNKGRKFMTLYENENFSEYFKVYLNSKFITCAFIFSTKEKCVGKKISLEDRTRWILEEKYKREFGFDNWLKDSLKDRYKKEIIQGILNAKDINLSTNLDFNPYQKAAQKHLFSYAKENKDLNFIFIIPTYSRITYHTDCDKNYENADFTLFTRYKTILEWFIKEAQQYKNVQIYGFDDLAYANNIDNYKDPTHYNADLNSLQLQAIASKTHKLDINNSEKYFKLWQENVLNFDIKQLQERIKAFQKENIK